MLFLLLLLLPQLTHQTLTLSGAAQVPESFVLQSIG